MVNSVSKKQFQDFISSSLNIDNFTVVPIAGDVSMRRYYRVSKENRNWVLMEWEPFDDPKNYPFISIQKYMADNNIHVPEINNYDQKIGLFIIEDLGDLTLERKFWELYKPQNIAPYYKAAIDELCKLHRLIFTNKNPKICHAYQVAFDSDKFVWEMNYTLKNLIQGYCKVELTPEQEKNIQSEFLHLASQLTKLPQVICHRDYHSRNIMVKGEKLVLIDFQDARLGPPQYDLVSLLHDSYVKMKMNTITDHINYYLSQLPEVEKLFSNRDEFMYYFELQTLQRCFKACGTFSAVFLSREDHRYLKHLPPTMKKVRKAIAKFDNYPVLSKLINELELPVIERDL